MFPLTTSIRSPEIPLDSPLIKDIRAFLRQRDYPCIAALRALERNELQGAIYQDFGSVAFRDELRLHLSQFLQEQKQSESDYLTFLAVFEGPAVFSEEEFEHRLWQELSALTSEEDRASDWGSNVSNPEQESFSFCLFGEPFFVVGLHPGSTRKGRRFSRPTLIFNVFRQFESLQKKGAYDPMVRTNRLRDLKFDGSVNPMVEEFGENWESIQFSGKKNSRQWRCPFRFLHKLHKKERA